jgi:hypothetical protein
MFLLKESWLVATDQPIDDWSIIDEVGVLIKKFVAFVID